jgi:membrane protease YdiL (CAAX protease family)
VNLAATTAVDAVVRVADPSLRRRLKQEIWLVLGVSLGASGVYALLSFYVSATTGPLRGQATAPLVGSFTPGRPWVDLTYQVLGTVRALVPVLLVVYFLHWGGERALGVLGIDLREKARDLARGAVLAAIVGGTGLAFYLLARASGFNLAVVAVDLPPVWWRLPVLVMKATQNAVVEEVIVAGFLLHRLAQLGWRPNTALLTSALVRGSYHLYQGLGGFVGNVAMGLLFGRLYQRWGRTMPLVVAHALIDSVAFVGYVLLRDRVTWLS